MVNGYCDERFIEAKKVFEESIDSGFELGCAITMECKAVTETHLKLPTNPTG